MSKPAILTVLVGGGFSFETRCLMQGLAADAEIVYLTTEFGGVPGEAGIPPGESFPVPSFATVTDRSRRRSAVAFMTTFRITLAVLRKRRIAAVVVVGSSHAVPMFLAGRVLGRKCVFVESVTRVDQLSLTGRLVTKLRLASHVVAQWPGLQRRNPGTQLGTIL